MKESRWVSDIHWRREGQQSRSERTQAALLDAAEALILEKGTEATSIADIAARAGCAVGTVYHHFKDKKALFFALFHRMTDTYAVLSQEAARPENWEGASIRDLLRGYLEVGLRMSKEAGAVKAAVSAVMADHPELAAHYSEIQAETRRAILKLVLERRHEIGRPDAEVAASFAIDQLAAMLRGHVDPFQIRAALLKPSDAVFVENAMQLMAAFLRLPEGA